MGRPSISPLFLLTTAATALNTVYFKCMMNCYKSEPGVGDPHDYAVFVSVFDILLWAVFMSAVARAGGWSVDIQRFGRRNLLRTAGADQLCTLLATIGAAHVPGQAQVLLNQSVLPITMALSLVLGRRYSAAEVFGAGLVLAGATVAAGLSPLIAPHEEALRAGVVIFSMAQAAAAVAGIVKEDLLQEARTGAKDVEPTGDPIALGVAVAWLRVPLGIAMALVMRRGDGTVLAEFYDGWRCFLGERPRLGDTGCSAAGRTTLLSVAYYAAQTLLGLRLTQRGSATLRSIAAVTAVPLAQFLFTSESVMSGAGAEAYGRGSALGLALCLTGFSIYLRGQQRGQSAVGRASGHGTGRAPAAPSPKAPRLCSCSAASEAPLEAAAVTEAGQAVEDAVYKGA
mmetsp:Transcript_50626/g.151364  ORF Transcript_50626/g.151364 Transcript_50626/m.151364 type:complete len:398 (-) Transcript_50626:41-1234(-)